MTQIPAKQNEFHSFQWIKSKNRRKGCAFAGRWTPPVFYEGMEMSIFLLKLGTDSVLNRFFL
ncbi:hypothetical protein M5W84_27315, partial [Paenibacillus thiaminolyticus]|uniref:hypothetical protein n=1 Tax=Paenibacillus thiaminolyticus TaxID=49283 RepID=UPI00227FC37D